MPMAAGAAPSGRVHETVMAGAGLPSFLFPDSATKINRARKVFGEDDLNSGWPLSPGGLRTLDNHQAQSDALATLTRFSAPQWWPLTWRAAQAPGPLELVRGRGWRPGNGTLIQQLPPPVAGAFLGAAMADLRHRRKRTGKALASPC